MYHGVNQSSGLFTKFTPDEYSGQVVWTAAACQIPVLSIIEISLPYNQSEKD